MPTCSHLFGWANLSPRIVPINPHPKNNNDLDHLLDKVIGPPLHMINEYDEMKAIHEEVKERSRLRLRSDWQRL
jgi:hypothetical protein